MLKNLLISLKSFYNDGQAAPSLFNHWGFSDDSILLGRDGSLSTSWYYAAPDHDSSMPAQRDYQAAGINAALRLGTGWSFQFDAVRVQVKEYLDSGAFPDATSQTVENNRREFYLAGGLHLETIYALTLSYLPSQLDKLGTSLTIQNPASVNRKVLDNVVERFKQKAAEVEDELSQHLSLQRMSSAEQLTFISYCVVSEEVSLCLPSPPCYLNYLLGGHDIEGGFEPRIDDKNIGVISPVRLPYDSFSSIISPLYQLPFDGYRLSHRFIAQDPVDASRQNQKIYAAQNNRRLNIVDEIFRFFSPESASKRPSQDVDNQTNDVAEAATLAEEDNVHFGFYTFVVIAHHEDKEILRYRLREIKKLLDSLGFRTRIETANTLAGFLGSIPGNGNFFNVRRPLIHTLNLAHLVPTSNVFTGLRYNPHPRFPKNSPALFYARSKSTPFRFHLYVGDVGHSCIIGPTGAGKSTLLALIIISFLRYENAQIFCFDMGMDLYALVKACGGVHHNIGDGNEFSLYPLKDISDDAELLWALSWLEELITLQGLDVTPALRGYLLDGLESLRACEEKTLSNLFINIQNTAIRDALRPFIAIENGPMAPLLDSIHDTFGTGHFHVFETQGLTTLGARFSAPVLTAIFHKIERRLDGNRPTIITLDEGWSALDNPIFSTKIREWLKTLRKKLASVIFSSQQISDFTQSTIADAILDSCPTKVFLPNEDADNPTIRPFYESLGLNDIQIGLISSAQRQRDYYYTSPVGNRMIELCLDPVFLSFVGKNSYDDLQAINTFETKYGDHWPARWLESQGLPDAAADWEEIYQQLQGETL